jgi:ABC-2 type transport system permease protein
MRNILRIARKEMAGYFDSPAGYIFIAVFLAVSLFACFWLDVFFARDIADVRPLFHWMPVLLVFLVSALTMRMWSEERRSGTLEILLSAPLPLSGYVLGKFLAGLALVAIALTLTLPLPFTVSLLGPLDWGPVVGGYLAALFLASAYLAIGLFVSARSDNQIVSLIVTAVICAVFYLIGSDLLGSLFGNRVGQVLHLLGSGSRFDSIERGVVDLRDLYYYLSITGMFLTLNVLSLERLRWAADGGRARHRFWYLASGLMVANFLAGNLWLQQIPTVRADLTEGHVYTLSSATRGYLNDLQEPLLIIGYFSARTHPLLAPLVPQLEDLLREYAVAGHGKVRVEFIDPQQDPAAAKEAASHYGVRPVPFQTASKYQASVVNSYFNIVIAYGDQYETLGFRDLIEVKSEGETDLAVDLRNPEYDVTRAVKKVLYAYQGGGNLFSSLSHPVTFNAYVSPAAKLPDALAKLGTQIAPVLDQMKADSGGKLTYAVQDPDADGGALAKRLEDQYGFRPLALSLVDPQSFWFYMTLESGDRVVQISLPDNLDAEGLKQAIRAGLKQFATGYLHTVAVYSPPPSGGQYGMAAGSAFSTLEDKLRQSVVVKDTDLANGRVPAEADLLLLLSPQHLNDKQVYAVDQFLMRGGTVIAATSPFDIAVGDSVTATKTQSGLDDWLKHNGLSIEDRMVLDPQNSRLPIPVDRDLGGITVREIRVLDYPYFADLRGDGMPASNGPTAGLAQLTMPWASPIDLDAALNKDRHLTRLLQSSSQSWTSDSLDVAPTGSGGSQFSPPPKADFGRKLLGVAVEGRFTSYFQGKPSPLLTKPATDQATKPGDKAPPAPPPDFAGQVDVSPDSARIILLASNSALADDAMALGSAGARTEVLAPVQLIENAIDWSLEDRDLLAIRSRANFSRLLIPMSQEAQQTWEYLDYGLAFLGLVAVWAIHRLRRRAARRRTSLILAAKGA